MFQTFETSSDPSLAKPRVAALRAELVRRKLDAYIVPRADEHQGEYVPPCAERLHWLTGFSGSAGLAAVTAKSAAVFVDGRYTVQARGEVDTKLFSIEAQKPGALADWLAGSLKEGEVAGFDPALWTIRQVEELERVLKPKGIKLRAVKTNLLDRIWGGARPAQPSAPVRLHPVDRSGREASDKIADIQATLDKEGQDACILTLPDSISWLFNIRGGDVAHNPVVLAFAIVHRRAKPELFIAPEKLDKETRAELKAVARLKKPDDLDASLKALRNASKRVRLDPATAAFCFLRAIGANNVARAADPCILPKARKNETEIAGARRAHVRDGVAVVRFLHWLDEAVATGELPDEIGAVAKLEGFRAETGELAEISFDTISGSGPNGAIVHYRVSEATNRQLEAGELFLIDSGAQYVDGTTDITRTIAIGDPTDLMVRDATLVLKGHIAIATALFPKGTRGIDLDPFARRALWVNGLDYDHGTGHGVGSYLSVHEGPASISRAGMVPLEPGMILSNEPGLYREGQYGIRLENLVLAVNRSNDVEGDRETFGFETLTLAPFDRRLIDKRLLSPDEVAWLDAYHIRVRDTLMSRLEDSAVEAWLSAACAPL